MRQLFEHVLASSDDEVAADGGPDAVPTPIVVFDDDAIVHKSFRDVWATVSLSERCTGFLRENNNDKNEGASSSSASSPGGILLLGAAQWGGEQAWKRISEMQNMFEPEHRVCYSAGLHTFGSFATVYTKDAMREVLKWMEHSDEPFDHVYGHMMQQGFPVRIAKPNLVVMNTSHTSSVDDKRKDQSNQEARAQLHGWDLSLYT